MSPQRGRLLSIAVLLGAVLMVALAIVLSLVQGQLGRWPLPGPDATALPIGAVDALPPGAMRVLAAGDIGRCGSVAAAATGALLDAIPDATVIALGDNAYDQGTVAEYTACYDPVWGAARTRTLPVPGNHEYEATGASGYFAYFGAAAGTPGMPWRARDLGDWRIYLLDVECDAAGRCDEDLQLDWLRRDLAAHPSSCVLAAMHRPRFSSGPHGSQAAVDPLWRALAEAGADIVLAAHDHLYERFAPMDAVGAVTDGGLRSWVVGTGGDNLYHLGRPVPGSERRTDRTHGVLELALSPGGYDWRFRAVIGEPFEDTGSGTC